ncbi:N-acetylmuramic acid 6-phosphate etherase [Mitsuokella sp. AF21-1AC]|uniref:N-acetylmuramic acid 6-phosphate etherase n=1 Tax=Mitsuokella sp. AF21-1AC TaxID=2292235 RepID=UPI000E49BED9|nr:N-acetylmuramic acid 6-phosphate etherase [Mitsuokella sp. AF21-1AC]RGS72842.1 N-acetylmuramic acid 6-phosphate etherase [Mitsuokella sp. AF21-1AC]
MIDLGKLTTEQRNPATTQIDCCPTEEMVTIMQAEDAKVSTAIRKILPEIARAIDATAARLADGGRLFYIGAGTSGRLGVLDASECPPTYGTDPELVQGIIAGGEAAMFRAQEGAEDDLTLAEKDLAARHFTKDDVLVGIAASGRTPYVIGGLRYAKKLGALTIALSCSEGSEIAKLADIALTPVTGPEIVTGSTRMKAGTAQKLVLNMLSTGTMIRLGKVYGNLMVDVKASNHKLEERARRIVMQGSGCSREEAEAALRKANGRAKLAILLVVTGSTAEEGRKALQESRGHLREAIRSFTTDCPKGAGCRKEG